MYLSQDEQRECMKAASDWAHALRTGGIWRGPSAEAELRYSLPLKQAMFIGWAVKTTRRWTITVNSESVIERIIKEHEHAPY